MIREGASAEEARSKIWMYDVHGLIVDVSFSNFNRMHVIEN
jgi:hypothetical protein